VHGGRKIQYHLDVVPERGHIGGGDVLGEEVEYMYYVHIQVEGRPVCGEDREQGQQVLPMLFLGFAVRAVVTIRILSLSHWRAWAAFFLNQ
jgi:hypothetical protein